MGLTKTDFTLFADLAGIIAADLRADTRAETEGGDRYLVSSTDLGGGSLMSNGLYANPIDLGWDNKLADFTSKNTGSYQVDASANTVDIAIPALTVNDSFIYHNLITSTFKVQILNPTETIKGKGGDIAAGTNMELEAGQSVQLVAKSTTVLSIVGALV